MTTTHMFSTPGCALPPTYTLHALITCLFREQTSIIQRKIMAPRVVLGHQAFECTTKDVGRLIVFHESCNFGLQSVGKFTTQDWIDQKWSIIKYD